MQIIRQSDAPSRTIQDEVRRYYLDDALEIIITMVPAGYEQPLHRHERITEATYVIDGTIDVIEGESHSSLRAGDYVIFRPGDPLHTVRNPSASMSTTLTIKLLPSLDSAHAVFARDKVDY